MTDASTPADRLFYVSYTHAEEVALQQAPSSNGGSASARASGRGNTPSTTVVGPETEESEAAIKASNAPMQLCFDDASPAPQAGPPPPASVAAAPAATTAVVSAGAAPPAPNPVAALVRSRADRGECVAARTRGYLKGRSVTLASGASLSTSPGNTNCRR